MRARICVLLSMGICLGFLGCGNPTRPGDSSRSGELAQQLTQTMGRLKSLERKQAAMEADLLPVFQIKPHADKAVETVERSASEVKSVMADLTSAQGQLMAALKDIETLKERIAQSEKTIADNKKSVEEALKILENKDVELGKKDAKLESELKSVSEEGANERKKLASKDASLDKQDLAILTMMRAVEEAAEQERIRLMQDTGKAGRDANPPPLVDPSINKLVVSPLPSFDVMLRFVEQAAKAERSQLNLKDAALNSRDHALETKLKHVESSATDERAKLADKDASLDRQDLAILTMMKTVEETAKRERLKLVDAKLAATGDTGSEPKPLVANKAQPPAASAVTFAVMLKTVEQAAKEERQQLNQKVAAHDQKDSAIEAILNNVEKAAKDAVAKLAEQDTALEKRDNLIVAMLKAVEATSQSERQRLEQATKLLREQDITHFVMLQDVEKASKDERSKLARSDANANDANTNKKQESDAGRVKLVGGGAGKKETTPPEARQTFDALLKAVKAAATAERLSSVRADAAMLAEHKALLAKLQASEVAAKVERAKLSDRITKLSEQDVSILNLVKSLAETPPRNADETRKSKDDSETRSQRKTSRSDRFTTFHVPSAIDIARLGGSILGVPFPIVRIADFSRLITVKDDKPRDAKSDSARPKQKGSTTTNPPPSKPESFEDLLKKVKKTATAQRKIQQESGSKLNEVIETLEDKDRGLIAQLAELEKRLKVLEEIKVIKTELMAERGRTTDLVTRVKSLETGSKALKFRLEALAAIGNNKKDPAIIAAGELLVRRVTVVDDESHPILVLDGSKRVPSIAFHPRDERQRVIISPGRVSGALAIESRNGRFLFLNR